MVRTPCEGVLVPADKIGKLLKSHEADLPACRAKLRAAAVALSAASTETAALRAEIERRQVLSERAGWYAVGAAALGLLLGLLLGR